MRFLLAAIAAVLIFAGGAGGGALELAPEAEVVVNAIGDGLVQVDCTLYRGGFGSAYPGAGLIYVEPFVCRRINALVADPEAVAALPDSSRLLFRTALALSILTHESWHMSPSLLHLNEAWADCMEIQTSWAVAELLGADEVLARRLARISLDIHYLKVMFAPDYDDPVRCRAGGAWDQHPETPDFPVG